MNQKRQKDDDKDSKKSKGSESSFIDKAKDAVNSVKNTFVSYGR